MISDQHRFHGHSSLGFAFRRGSTVRTQDMTLKFVYNQRRLTYRATVIVERKTEKSAVARNRIRRRVYEIIRNNESAINGPYDMVVHVLSNRLASLPTSELADMVVGLLRQAGVIQGTGEPSARHPRGIVKTKEDNS